MMMLLLLRHRQRLHQILIRLRVSLHRGRILCRPHEVLLLKVELHLHLHELLLLHLHLVLLLSRRCRLLLLLVRRRLRLHRRVLLMVLVVLLVRVVRLRVRIAALRPGTIRVHHKLVSQGVRRVDLAFMVEGLVVVLVCKVFHESWSPRPASSSHLLLSARKLDDALLSVDRVMDLHRRTGLVTNALDLGTAAADDETDLTGI